ncbi:hypothetical protein ACLD9W_07645 [Neisseria sp. WLZKY-1]
MQTISSREFNQNVAKAKNMSDTAPVCITGVSNKFTAQNPRKPYATRL